MDWGEIKEFVRGAVAALSRYGTIGGTSASGMDDSMKGYDLPGDPQGRHVVRRMWPFGIRSRPPVGCETVKFHVRGGSSNAVIFGAESAEWGPGDLAEGETAIYSKQNPKIVHGDANGATHLTAKAGQNVDVNGGTLKVARDTDPVEITGGSYTPATLTLSIKDQTGAAGTLAISVAAGVLVVTSSTATPAGTFTMHGTITDGAARFKA